MFSYDKLTIFDHPLIQHKIGILRDKNTPSSQFRNLVTEITTLMGYEAMRDLPLRDIEVETPLMTCNAKEIDGIKLTVVPILRAGTGMVDGITSLVPAIRIGYIGLYRDEETLQPVPYFCKLPKKLEERLVIVTDPMLATGGSGSAALDLIKENGGKHIKFMCLIAAPEGIERIQKDHPDVEIYCAHLDDCLNDKGYILPGLGDAGDRIFGTK